METLFACLTPPGRAAIATLALRGPRAWDITRQFFQPARGALPAEPHPGKYWFGRLGADSRDEVILAVKEAGECPVLEVHCHGGSAVVQMIQELYVQQGALAVSWQHYLERTANAATGSGPILVLLAQAPTTRTASILLDQVASASVAGGAWQTDHLARLHELVPLGQHLVEPWKVVIAGAPNVGKSSLMNALAGTTRSIVSPIPGTTRDVVTTRMALDGWPIEMTDTAGLRPTAHALEQQGIELARAALEQADLRLWLVDGSVPPIFPDDLQGWCWLINKTDLPAAWDWHQVPEALCISAQTQAGLPELCATISRRLVPRPPAPGEMVPCLPAQWAQVRAAYAAQGARS